MNQASIFTLDKNAKGYFKFGNILKYEFQLDRIPAGVGRRINKLSY